MRLEHTLWWRHILHILNGISKGPFYGAGTETDLLDTSHQRALEACYSEEDKRILTMLEGKPHE